MGASTTSIDSNTSSAACSTQSAALAWGSVSTRVTERLPATATADRYTEVVVLPTPPFSAATTTITGSTLARGGGPVPGRRCRARSGARGGRGRGRSAAGGRTDREHTGDITSTPWDRFADRFGAPSTDSPTDSARPPPIRPPIRHAVQRFAHRFGAGFTDSATDSVRRRIRRGQSRAVAGELGTVVAEDDLAGHAAAEVGGEGDDEAAEVVGLAEAPERVRVDERRDRLVGQRRRTTGVSVVPGATASTRMPCGASSTASVSVRWLIAAFAAP